LLALLLLAAAVGLSNFAGAIGMGVSGVRGHTRVRVAVVFGLFEAGMPVVGLILGHGLALGLGHIARWVGGTVLIAVGVIGLTLARRRPKAGPGPRDPSRAGPRDPGRAGPQDLGRTAWGRVLVSGLALSADNLAAGFALGAYHTGLAVAATVFGAVSVAMSLIGLELGAKIGAVAGDWSEPVASVLLIAVGAAIAAGAL
jgi:manganese efflux pump family protein